MWLKAEDNAVLRQVMAWNTKGELWQRNGTLAIDVKYVQGG